MTDILAPIALTHRKIKAFVKKHGSPLFVINTESLRHAYRNFCALFPDIRPHYAVKALNHPVVIQTLSDLGSSFDCASGAEIQAVLAITGDPSRILFAHTIKRPADIEYAHAVGVDRFTLDSPAEVQKIARFAPGSRILVRIRVRNTGAQVELSSKFGAEPKDAVHLLRMSQQAGLRPVGISFHVGSQCLNVSSFFDALDIARNVFDQSKDAGIVLNTLDIGGGFPIHHFQHELDPLEPMTLAIRDKISRLFPDIAEIIAEPGRRIAGPSATLICRVIGKSERDGKPCYYIDDGVYGALSATLFDHAQFEYRTIRKGKRRPSILFGPTCDALDTIARDVLLPNLDIGDIVYIERIGAYSLVSATSFNGFGPPKVIPI